LLFRWQGDEYPAVSGAIVSKLDTYSAATGRTNDYLFIKHQLTIYPDQNAATSLFPEWSENWFPTRSWRPPEEIGFEPQDAEDQYREGCTQVSVNEKPIMTCRFLHQHGRIISFLIANVDGDRITFDLLGDVLNRLDNRLNEETIGSGGMDLPDRCTQSSIGASSRVLTLQYPKYSILNPMETSCSDLPLCRSIDCG
jgi:NADH:ubiquinone oxidoreductase subunit